MGPQARPARRVRYSGRPDPPPHPVQESRVIPIAALLVSSLATPTAPADVKVPRPLPLEIDTKVPDPHGAPAAHVEDRVRPAAARNAPSAPATRLDRVLVDEPGDGAVWVRGSTYKARFAPDGATYVPSLGSAAPRNFPVHLRVAGARVGDRAIALEDRAPVCAAAGSVKIDRGAFSERYFFGLESIEQTFVFDVLDQRGEIAVEIAVETELEARVAGAGLEFANDLGAVRYGAAVAIDGAGRRTPVSSAFENGRLVLTVPDAFVRAAELPLVIDPLITTFAVATNALDTFEADVAHDGATGNWIVVYEEAYSATDHDVYARITDGLGGIVAAGYVDFTTDYWARPRVASNAIAQQFLAVAAVGQPGSGARIIRARTVGAPLGAMGGQFTVSGAEAGEKLNPDVGGDPVSSPPTYYCVVWQRSFSATDQDIHARLVRSDGTLHGPGTILLDNSSSTFDTRPAISKSDGGPPFSTQQWTVVWQRPATGHGNVYGAQIHWDGTITHPTFPVEATSDDTYEPDVSSLLDGIAGTPRHYVVAWTSYLQNGDVDVVARLFDGTTSIVGTDVHGQVIELEQREQGQPSIDSDGQHFTLTYADRAPGSSERDVWVTDLLFTNGNLQVCEGVPVATGLHDQQNPRVACARSGGGLTQRAWVAWESVFLPGGGSLDVHAAIYQGGLGGCVRPSCFGDGSGAPCPCGNSGTAGRGCANSVNPAGGLLSWSGNPQVSADTFVLQGSGMPSSSCLYFQGTQFVNGHLGAPFGDGLRCAAGSVIRLGTKTNVGGASQYPAAGDASVSVRGMVPAPGVIRYYQVWYRNAAAFCTSDTFNLTNNLIGFWAP